MRNILFHGDAFEEYNEWALTNKSVFRKLIQIIQETRRQPFIGLGKPEPLKYMKGYWSRRITEEHRLVYKVTDESIIVASCKYHYKK